jgi:DNA-binding transcriptional ArsR family regulator
VASRTHELFGTLGHPQRLAILVYLLEQGEREVQQGEILEVEDLAGLHQSTVSQYLSALVKAGLVKKGRGKRGAYSVLMPDEAKKLILLAAELVAGSSAAATAEAERLRRRIRKTQLSVVTRDGGSAAAS